MSENDLKELEKNIEIMRSAGRTHIPIKLETIEKMIASERKRLSQRC